MSGAGRGDARLDSPPSGPSRAKECKVNKLIQKVLLAIIGLLIMVVPATAVAKTLSVSDDYGDAANVPITADDATGNLGAALLDGGRYASTFIGRAYQAATAEEANHMWCGPLGINDALWW